MSATSAAFALNGRRIAFGAVASEPACSPTETAVLATIQDWLTGAETFPLRTSGSTGTPKEICLTRTQLRASAARSVAALGLSAGDPTLVCLSIGTAGGLLGVVRALEHALPLTLIDPTGDVLAVVGESSVFATTSLVPLQVQAVLAHGAAGYAWLDRMKAVLIGGAAVSAALESALQAVAAPIYHTYGMTETASHVALRRLNGPARTDYFTALPGIELRLNSQGALEIRADVTNNEWLTTTDRAELIGANWFRWLGRLDDVINSGGVKVDAARVQRAVEEALRTHGLGHDVVVLGLLDARLGEQVVAWLGGPALTATQEANLRARLTSGLTRYEVPKELRVLPVLPRLPGGKIDRQTLRNRP
ncbi:MAG: AMP-binding protein [Hymenobacteraceae bacterium]|nr:AMP-binding protein [Hymenobacteraceae bacterium]